MFCDKGITFDLSSPIILVLRRRFHLQCVFIWFHSCFSTGNWGSWLWICMILFHASLSSWAACLRPTVHVIQWITMACRPSKTMRGLISKSKGQLKIEENRNASYKVKCISCCKCSIGQAGEMVNTYTWTQTSCKTIWSTLSLISAYEDQKEHKFSLDEVEFLDLATMGQAGVFWKLTTHQTSQSIYTSIWITLTVGWRTSLSTRHESW